ncbi:DUF6636 domain-containing protein [Mycobacterium sp.]|uniref:DUF6636 domain-containing protein n=1 Tax=Mycobacterium sp. TaxID=1785 RepID=UPI003D6A4980
MGSGERVFVTISTISAITAAPFLAIAHAESFYQFQSPSGNIDCGMGMLGGAAYASCEISDHTWVAPPRPARCEGAWGDRVEINQGNTPALVCSSDTLRGSGLPTLDYGSRHSAGPITCDSELAGVTCTDASTGHFFSLARDSYVLE